MPFSSRPALGAAALLAASLAGGCVPRVEPPQGQAVEQVASLTEKPGDPVVTGGGRLIFTMHPLNRPIFKLMERKADGSVVPFPDPDTSRTAFDNPLGIRAGRDGTLWILDMGDHAGAAVYPASRPPRLVGCDLGRNIAAKVIPLPTAVLRPNSWPQDFALDETRGIAVVADAMRADPTRDDPPAIIAVTCGAGRRGGCSRGTRASSRHRCRPPPCTAGC